MLAALGSGRAGEAPQGARVFAVWLSCTGTGLRPG